MTQEEKRIKLAEAGGWLVTDRGHNGYKLQGSRHGWKQGFKPEEPPNYFHDLNEVHELEKVLNAGQIITYLRKLYRYTKPAKVGANPWEIICVRVAIHATAAQRAEAIGLTLGLWK